MNLKNIHSYSTLIYHVLFWVGYFIFNFLRWGSYFGDYWYSFKSNLVEFPIHIVAVYFNVYYLIPKYILKKKYAYYVFSIIFLLILIYILRTSLNYLLVTKEIWPEAENAGKFLETNHIIAVVTGELYVLSFVTAIKLLIDWPIELKRNKELADLQLSTELKYLRTQIQPHFFFNTLNNLYALTLLKSDDAPRMVIKLSNLMQYILYEVNSSEASLLEEINHLNNYIDIQYIRYKEMIELEMDITGNIEEVNIPPFLFLTFLENCFKHGLRGSEKIVITMSFELTKDKYLEFKLINSYNKNFVNREQNDEGIGILNTKRRLNLLYANNYILDTHFDDQNYNLFLKIPVL